MFDVGMLRGGMTNTQGSCPGCGAHVHRAHVWSMRSSRDAYKCPSCGTFEYSNGGVLLPERTTLVALHDLVDCVQ